MKSRGVAVRGSDVWFLHADGDQDRGSITCSPVVAAALEGRQRADHERA